MTAPARRLRIGIDVGGTFTDVVAIDGDSFELVARLKVPTTHRAAEGVSRGIIDGLQQMLALLSARPDDIMFIAHSTTQATNALLNAPVYLAAGSSDTALPNAQAVRDIFKKNDIAVLWQDSSKGHEWANWRRYLAQTLPLMFKNTSGCD